MAGKTSGGNHSRHLKAGSIALCGLLVTVAAIRVINPTSIPILTGLVGTTPYFFLGTPLLLGISFYRRARWSAAIGLIALVLFGYWASADFRFGPGIGDGIKPANSFRIATANLAMSNSQPANAMREVTSSSPDLIFLQELTPELWSVIEDAPELSSYKFRQVNTRGNPDGTAILSRLEILDGGVFPLDSTPITWADISVGGRVLRTINVHLSAPLSQNLSQRAEDQMEMLRDLALSIDSPLVVAGDFNATAQHRRFSSMTSGLLSDAHQEAGRGLSATWGLESLGWLPAQLRIDHVLFSNQLQAVHCWTASTPGSDHNTLIADLIIDAD